MNVPSGCNCIKCIGSKTARTHRLRSVIQANSDVIRCTKSTGWYSCSPLQRPALALDDGYDYDSNSSESYEEDDGTLDGVLYSYDNARVPGVAFDLVPQVERAVEQFQTKELAALVKSEYDIIDESEGDEEFELV